MEGTNEIKSITDLVEILTQLGEPAEGHTRFFRGQGNFYWDILPYIYRKDNPHLIKHEDKIIREALINCPDNFLPTDTLLDKLVKLQHYGYPTRLLDLTANALVGLYFASSNTEHHDKDGELVILDIPNQDIKYDDSDTVAILSAISLQNMNFDISNIFDKVDRDLPIKVAEKEIFLLNESSEVAIMRRTTIVDDLVKKTGKSFDEILDDYNTKRFDSLVLEIKNSHIDIIALLHNIRKDKPSFRAVINLDDLEKVICVKVKLNNARISRQQGSFLVFGIENSKINPATIPNEWIQKVEGQKILVKADAKANILKELKSFGISKQTLFPELESQASEIIEQYSK